MVEIVKRTNIVIHYITSDPLDEVFQMESVQFHPRSPFHQVLGRQGIFFFPLFDFLFIFKS